MEKCRCTWVPNNDSLYQEYHDTQWGVPVYDDRLLFEMLILEGAQAGLSWQTILKKRQNYKKAFDNFDAIKISKYKETKIHSLLQNEGIIRNKLKIQSTIKNAQVFLEIQKEFGSFSHYLWGFVNNTPIQNKITNHSDIPTTSIISDTLSKDLKSRGMNFVGSTIIYAFMQAIGMVNDHEKKCFRYKDLA